MRRKSSVKVIQSCLTLRDPMDYTVHGILQARILERVAFPFSRGSSQLRDRTQVSCIAGWFFTSWFTRKARGEKQEQWNIHGGITNKTLNKNPLIFKVVSTCAYEKVCNYETKWCVGASIDKIKLEKSWKTSYAYKGPWVSAQMGWGI